MNAFLFVIAVNFISGFTLASKGYYPNTSTYWIYTIPIAIISVLVAQVLFPVK